MKNFILYLLVAITVTTCCFQLPKAIDHELGIRQEEANGLRQNSQEHRDGR